MFFEIYKNEEKHILLQTNVPTVNVDVFSSFIAARSSNCVLKITEELKKTNFLKIPSCLILNLFIG